ncbi:transposable element Tcb1 transposase [Trichonephila clavipes]|nr:transposable element Tcb1 transposase [Trichonephila clavipes]
MKENLSVELGHHFLPSIEALHPIPGAIAWATIGYTTYTSLVRIDGNLNVDRNITGILRPVVVPYHQDLPNALYQQDNARLHVVCRVLTFYDTQSIRLLAWPARSPDFSFTEKIWSYVAESPGPTPLSC